MYILIINTSWNALNIFVNYTYREQNGYILLN